ncbi:hypothetical protein D3C87_574320 [compost metagenome]
MNDIKVKYVDVPQYIQEQMNEEFCMRWEESQDEDAVVVTFIDKDNLDGFRLNVGGQVVYFDYFTTCYSLIQNGRE